MRFIGHEVAKLLIANANEIMLHATAVESHGGASEVKKEE